MSRILLSLHAYCDAVTVLWRFFSLFLFNIFCLFFKLWKTKPFIAIINQCASIVRTWHILLYFYSTWYPQKYITIYGIHPQLWKMSTQLSITMFVGLYGIWRYESLLKVSSFLLRYIEKFSHMNVWHINIIYINMYREKNNK